MLEETGNRCLYCGLEFGSPVYRRGHGVEWLEIHWDHRVPYAYVNGNPAHNWAPACQLCNGYKAALMFDTLDEIRAYIIERARSHRHDPMPIWDLRRHRAVPRPPEPTGVDQWLAEHADDEYEHVPAVDPAGVDRWLALHGEPGPYRPYAPGPDPAHRPLLLVDPDPGGVDAWLTTHP
jgi:hypothetical protein